MIVADWPKGSESNKMAQEDNKSCSLCLCVCGCVKISNCNWHVCFVCPRVSCWIAVDWKMDTSVMHCFQHVSYVWPKTTPVVCRTPKRALGSEQINLRVRSAEAELLSVVGAGRRLIMRGQGQLRNCSTSQPISYCSFSAHMKGEMRITAIMIIFLHCCVLLLFTVNIPGSRAAKQRLV